MSQIDDSMLRMPPGRGGPARLLALIPGLVGLAFIAFLLVWFVWRVPVADTEILALVNKTGKILPAELAAEFGDQVVLYDELVGAIAADQGADEQDVREGYKGIRGEVYTAGNHFFNPYSFKRVAMPATFIADDQIGVLLRKYGKPLPFPKTVATEPDERGPVREILRPGTRHNINLLAYEVQTFPLVQIPAGRVGVVTLLSGDDPVSKNTYTVAPGEKGVQRKTLPPGLAPYNPYLQRVEIVDVRSQKYDMLGAEVIHFPSNDSFTITIEGTIEWAIRPDHVAEVTVAYGDREDILNKIILPNARSISRIQGSKLQAREFISGKTRTAFQESLYSDLRRKCWVQGIDIKAALVRDIQPPAEIATLISQREQADQEIERYTNQMEEARAQAELVTQEELQEQNKAVGDARREVVTVTKQAEERKVISVTHAQRELEVAKLRLEAATKEAAALLARGEAEANVILLEYKARAEPLAQAVAAFGDGTTYANRFFLEKLAPSIRSIQSNTEGSLADIFKQFQTSPTAAKGGAQ